MKREMKLVAAATAAAILAGCASGGSSTYGNDVIGDNPLELLLCAPLFICGAKKNTASSETGASTVTYSSATYGSAVSPSMMTSWSDLPADTYGNGEGPRASIGYSNPELQIVYVSEGIGRSWYSGIAGFQYDADGKIVRFDSMFDVDTYTDLSGVGQTGIDFGYSSKVLSYRQSSFTSAAGNSNVVGLIANPYKLGWDYQSFGAWDEQRRAATGTVDAHSFGAATPASAVPLGGSAIFIGKLGGFYVSPAGEGSIAAADLTVHANFGARTLGLASSGTVLTRDLTTAVPAPNLNLSGTLSYAAGSSRFDGTLGNAGATMNGLSHGQFYGPAAEELGGAFALRAATGTEAFVGAYGAKR